MTMRFAKQGYVAAAAPAGVGVVAALLVGWMLAVPILLFALAVLLFFRDPERVPPSDPSLVIAPADGRVVSVEQSARAHRMAPAATTKISIFMSPLDVHVNRMPVSGTVESIEHRPGRFSAAYSPEASEVNESNSLLVRADAGYSLVVVQIAGWLARRIVCYITEKTWLTRGERFGLIMFGSRVDVFLPESARACVRVGQRVVAGESPLAEVAAVDS